LLEKTIFHWVGEYGYAGIVALLMLGIVGLPVPDETLLTFSGYLVFKHKFHAVPAMTAALAGSICGITLSYFLGRKFGYPLIHRYGRYIHISDRQLNRTHQWLEHTGGWSLTFGYFFPGIRHITAYIAGTTELGMPAFAVHAYSGAFLWCGTFIFAGYWMGDGWSRISHQLHSYALLLMLIAAAAVVLYFLTRRLREPKPS
jgi:membrane protein DedA with SNARE-associated domain